jgi:hypothetical protein
MGKLVGFNPEMKSYRILTKGGTIINSKSFTFLYFAPKEKPLIDFGKLLTEEKVERTLERTVEGQAEEHIRIKEEEEDIDKLNEDKEFHNAIPPDAKDESEGNNKDIAELLVPVAQEPVGRIL